MKYKCRRFRSPVSGPSVFLPLPVVPLVPPVSVAAVPVVPAVVRPLPPLTDTDLILQSLLLNLLVVVGSLNKEKYTDAVPL